MATRFWVGGTGTWDASTTTHWAATTGTAGGQTVPGSADTVTFDGASGGGVVTVNTTVNVTSITMGAFTGTLDFSANNNNVTAQTFSGTGTGVRTLNMGNGTCTLTSATGTPWNFATTTGLTFNANSSSIVLAATTASSRSFSGAGLTYSTVSFGSNSLLGAIALVGANTIGTWLVTAPNAVSLPNSVTQVITNAFSWSGSSSSLFSIQSNSASASATISIASGSPSISWAGLRGIACTGGAVFAATNSLDLGINSGITITPPSAGGGGLAPAPIVIGRGTPY